MNFWMGHLGDVYKPVDSLLSRWMIFTSKFVIVNSMAMEERYTRFLPGMAKRKIRVIYNGSDFNFPVTISADVLRNEIKIAPTDIIVAMIARLDPWKDFESFLVAAAMAIAVNKHVKFLLIGDGLLRTDLENKIMQLNLQENMFILGEKKDIYNYINLTDISVLSTKGEGFSNSILESMAFGKPVAATDVGGNAELLGRTNEYGFLIPPNSPILFAETLNKLIESEGLRKQVGLSAKIHIKKICNIKRFVTSYEEIFEQAILK
jgi:glycosyltransferase involved in cell wall biosynthesis